MANKKKEYYKAKPITEGKRNIIQGLLQEYNIETAADMPVTSATAWTALRYRSMMISASELPSGRLLQPVSLTASRPDADWIRSCSGRISQRCWTGTPQPQSQSLARLSVRSAARCCVRLKRLSE